MTTEYGYAVVVQYWNGNTYTLSMDNITVYRDKTTALAEARTIEVSEGAEVLVDVIDAEIK